MFDKAKYRYWVLFLWLVLLSFVAYCSFYSINMCLDGVTSSRWPSVIGNIKSLNTSYTIGDQTEYVDITYLYVVNGKEYSGERISYRMFDGSVDIVRDKFLSGEKDVVVFYNPKKVTSQF